MTRTKLVRKMNETPESKYNGTGHVNDFDEKSMRALFGPEADLRTFRCNATFALLTAFGRKLPPRPRNFFYQLDLRVAMRFGSPHRRFVPLRNRDWLIVTRGAAAEAGPREWRCPQCRGPLVSAAEGLRCPRDELTYGFAAPGVPEFVETR
jgi:hypothetical protein